MNIAQIIWRELFFFKRTGCWAGTWRLTESLIYLSFDRAWMINVWSETPFLTELLLACRSVSYSSNSGNSWKAWEAPLERGSYLNSPPVLPCSVKSTHYSHGLHEILSRLLLDTTLPCWRCRGELGIWEQCTFPKGKIPILLEAIFP